MWTKVEKDSVYHFDKIELFIPLENENAVKFLSYAQVEDIT